MNKDKWAEEIINTAGKIDPVKASPALYDAIKGQLDKPSVIQMVSVKWMYAAAIAIGILLAFNISIWKNMITKDVGNEDPLYQSEFSLTGNNAYSLNY